MLPVKQQAFPNLKRKQKVLPLNERVPLERVLGLTVTSTAALAVDHNTGLVAYPAGCVVVLYNPRKNKQTHIVNTSKKAITCLAFSRDGRQLATGECGHQPAVRVWELEDRTQIAEFKGHKFGINVVAFSPNLKYLVSIGSQYDMLVNVWNWKTQSKVATNKVATKVTDITFTEDGSTFITVGNRHVKFWNMESGISRIKETLPLKGHSGILGEQKNNFFCGVCSGCGAGGTSTFTVTRSGLLCELNERRLLDKWVELRTPSASCLAAGKYHIFVGCANGVVRIFSTKSLHFLATMPRPHHLGVDVASGIDPSLVLPAPDDARYPDVTALALDDEACKLSCIYNDHSLYVWDVHDIKKIGKSRSFLYHSAAIWGLEIYSPQDGHKPVLPPGSFLTCGGDDTIRVWNTETHMSTETAYKRNIYSNELIKVLYTDTELNNILDLEFNPAGVTDKKDVQSKDLAGVRSLSVSHDGRQLASGDRVGNIRIYDLQFMDQLHMLEAHDSEVLSLSYTDPDSSGLNILASAGRDRLLHVFDIQNGYGLIQTLDDHSAAITAVDFINNDDQFSMISCGADKSILFRTPQKDPDLQFVLNKHLVAKATLYDMCVDPKHKFIATACQDRNIRIYNTKNGKQKKSYSGSVGTEGTLIRMDLDRSGSYVATSCSNKNVTIFDFFSGDCLASMFGHSEVVTGVKFTSDFKHLISVSGDGCIFQWRLPYDMSEHMQTRLKDLGQEYTNNLVNSQQGLPADSSQAQNDDIMPMPDKNANLPEEGGPVKVDYRFSVGQLPSWAKRQMAESPSPQKSSGAGIPRGRWAQRVDDQVVMKSVLDESSVKMGTADLDRRRMTFEENSILDQADFAKPLVQTIIADDESNRDDDEDDEFKSCPTEEFLHKLEKNANFNGTYNKGKITFGRGKDGDGGAMEAEAEDEEEDEQVPEKDVVVFFPPKDDEEESIGAETVASSYRVFGGDNLSMTESESTDLPSVDSDEDDLPRTSLGDTSSAPNSPDGEEFMRTNFDMSNEEFGSTFQEPPPVPADMTHRLSISTRFLSRSQQQHLRSSAKTSLQKRKDEMAQAVLETRRRLQALGWKVGDSWDRTAPGGRLAVEQAVPERDLTPTSPSSIIDQNALEDNSTNKRQSTNGRGRITSKERSDAKASYSINTANKRGLMTIAEAAKTPERRRWQTNNSPVAANVRKWNSMFDVTGRTMSPALNQSSAAPPTRPPRSRTPTPMAGGRLSLSPRRSSSPSPGRHGLYAPRTGRRATRGRRSGLPVPSPATPVHKRAPVKSGLPVPQWRHLSVPQRQKSACSDGGDEVASLSGAGDSDSWELMSDVSEGSTDRGSTTTSSTSQRLSSGRYRKEEKENSEPTSPNRSRSMYNLSQVSSGGTGSTDGKAPGKQLNRTHSYRSATQSSRAKNRQSTGGSKELPAASVPQQPQQPQPAPSRRSVGKKGRLNPALKNKFKSTPDLMAPESEDSPSLSPSRTTEDLGEHPILQRRGSADISREIYRHSTAAIKEKKNPYEPSEQTKIVPRSCDTGATSPTLSSSSGYMSTASSVPSRPGAGLGPTSPPGTIPDQSVSASSFKPVMPPPASIIVLKPEPFLNKTASPRRATMPELTLAQAKEILLGKSSMTLPVTSVSRRSILTEGSPSTGPDRPHSAAPGTSDSGKQPSPGKAVTAHLTSVKEVREHSIRGTPSAVSPTKSKRPATGSSPGASEQTVSTVQPKPTDTQSKDDEVSNQNQVTTFRNNYASPMDLPEKDVTNRQGNTTSSLRSSEPSRSKVELVLSSPSPRSCQPGNTTSTTTASTRAGVPESRVRTTLDPAPTTADSNQAPDKRNVTFVVEKEGQVPPPQSPSPTRTPASPCLVNRLGGPISPIRNLGGEPDVAGHEDNHQALPGDNSSPGDGKSKVTPSLDKVSDTEPPMEGNPEMTDQRSRVPSGGILTHLTRRRDPSARNCISPTRQLGSTVVLSPPSIPAPQAIRDTSPVAGPPPSPSGRLSPTKSLGVLNRDAVAARWQRAQQNRDRQRQSGRNMSRGNSLQSSESESEGSESSNASSELRPRASSEPRSSGENDKKIASPNATNCSTATEPKSLTLTTTESASDNIQQSERLLSGSFEDPNLARPSADHHVVATSEHQDVIRISEDQDVTTVSEDQDVIRVSEDQDVTKVSEDQDVIRVSEDQDVIRVSEDQDVTTVPEDRHLPTAPVMGSSLQTDVDVEEEIQRPDKSRSSPPASLTTSLTAAVKQSIVLAEPSPVRVSGQKKLKGPDDLARLADHLKADFNKALNICSSNPQNPKDFAGREMLQKALLDIHASLNDYLGLPNPDLSHHSLAGANCQSASHHSDTQVASANQHAGCESHDPSLDHIMDLFKYSHQITGMACQMFSRHKESCDGHRGNNPPPS